MRTAILIALAATALTACKPAEEPRTMALENVEVTPLVVKPRAAPPPQPLPAEIRLEEPDPVVVPDAPAEDTRFCADEGTIDSYAQGRGYEPSDINIGPGIVTYVNPEGEQLMFEYLDETEVCLLTDL